MIIADTAIDGEAEFAILAFWAMGWLQNIITSNLCFGLTLLQ